MTCRQSMTTDVLEKLESRDGTRPYTENFAAGDHAAMTAISCLTRRGVRVPEQISLIGFGDLEGSDRIYPALKTVNQDIAVPGHRAAEGCILGAMGEGIDLKFLESIHVRLVVRVSTAPAHQA